MKQTVILKMVPDRHTSNINFTYQVIIWLSFGTLTFELEGQNEFIKFKKLFSIILLLFVKAHISALAQVRKL